MSANVGEAQRVDLRSALALERRISPALLLAAAAAAYSVSGGARAWIWFAAIALAIVLRFVLALRHHASRDPVVPGVGVGRLYLLLHAADLALWAIFFAALLAPRPVSLAVVSAAAAITMLLAALTLSAVRAPLLIGLAGWAVIVALGVARAGPSGIWLAAGLLPWLAATAWLSWARGTDVARALDPGRAAQGTLSGRTRFGWQAAIRAVPTPLIVIRLGRVVEVNEAALSFLGRDERSVIGLPVDECIHVAPSEALLPTSSSRNSTTVQVLPASRTFEGEPWSARVRVLSPGKASSAVVIALTRPATTVGPFAHAADDAIRLASWIGGESGYPWYRDDRGRVFLPNEFGGDPSATNSGASGFPLAGLVEPSDRERAQAAWTEAIARNRVFDERLRFAPGALAARVVRVTALLPNQASASSPVIGMIAPVAALAHEGEPASNATVRATAGAIAGGSDALLSRLPVLVWVVDARGHVVHTEGADPWRWGRKDAIAPRPLWSDAFNFIDPARADVVNALRRALAGRPSFDLINSRTTRSGGRVVLRSHFVPLDGDGKRALSAAKAPAHRQILVLDTIASPQQLSEIDRLRRSKAQYRALVESSTSLIWAVDATFKLTFASRRAAREIYGYLPQELLGQSVGVLLAPQVDQSAARHVLASLRIGQSFKDVEMMQQAKDGQRVIVSVSARPLVSNDGSFMGALGMSVDLTMLKQRERRLTEALRVERTVLDSAGQAIAVIKDGQVARCNDAFLHLMEATPGQMARTPLADYFADTQVWNDILAAADAEREQDRAAVREVQIRRGKHDVSVSAPWCQLTARSIAPGEYVIVLTDIDHIRQREADALHDAHHDDLTGLPNRRLLGIRAAGALSAAGTRHSSCAVLALDLDGFKQINDRHGHKVGDTVLKEIAVRIERTMRPQDTVARRGGDEFAVLIPDAGGSLDIERIAERILAAVEQPLTLMSGDVTNVSASIGVAVAPEHGREFERLMQLADLAMYEAKLRGKNRFAFVASADTAPATTDYGPNVTPLTPRGQRSNGTH